jgi:hypothetical protein
MYDYFFLTILNYNIAQLSRCKCSNMYLSNFDLKVDTYCIFFGACFVSSIKSQFEMVDFNVTLMKRDCLNTNKI